MFIYKQPKEYIAYGIMLDDGKPKLVLIARGYSDTQVAHAARRHAYKYANKPTFFQKHGVFKDGGRVLSKVIVR